MPLSPIPTRPSAARRLCGLVLFLPCAVSVSATAQTGPRERHAERAPTILTISGGISLGSYQAGVNWALLEVFKRTARDSVRRAWNLPRYEIAAMAGASAGNINAFLTAVEWCRSREHTPAMESLFWQVWIHTGIEQLFPEEDDDPDAARQGLFTREFFWEVHLDTLSSRMRNATSADAPTGCAVPVGVTVSRLEPGRVSITPELQAPTQRFAALAQVARRSPTEIVFTPPPDHVRGTHKLGSLVDLPAEADGTLAMDDVFNVILASSAFPGAFAPVYVRYRDSTRPGCQGEGGTDCITSAPFADGGLFDNNPIDLAAGIYNETTRPNAAAADSNAVMIYISPDELRGRYAAAQEEPDTPPADGGIGALFSLMGGAIPSARQYELHSFARLLERAPNVFVRENIKVTDRAFPVVGEQLGAFAAFLGRPFREADFFVGVYDALAFFSREACRVDAVVDTTCATGRLGQFVREHDFAFGSPASAEGIDHTRIGTLVLERLYEWEHGAGSPDSAFRGPPPGSPHDVVTLAILRANATLAGGFDNDRCRHGDLIVNLMCHDGFRTMLADFARPPALEALDRMLAQRSEACRASGWMASAITCEATPDFRTFVREPERYMAALVGRLLHQLWRVEEVRDHSGKRAWTGIATISEMFYQPLAGYRYRRGFELNTSSIPRSVRGLWALALVPNYASLNLGARGFELGYRPTLHLSTNFTLGATLAPLHLIVKAVDPLETHRWVAGPTIHLKIGHPILSGIESGLEVFGRWRALQGSDAGRLLSIPLTGYFFADKIRINLRITPDNDFEVNDGATVAVSIGVSDLNGLVYWALR